MLGPQGAPQQSVVRIKREADAVLVSRPTHTPRRDTPDEHRRLPYEPAHKPSAATSPEKGNEVRVIIRVAP
ncbi:hypothetical protein [Streptomyces europaeiscabiei]|uniref:hypothetical protein n=1 Tax=Streptomyces europaeiscabiei TaxID=146819 RepID=UPI002E0E604D|nr:hypothetical protein OHB30_36855 [Streptomyces europaeiscabiei]